MSALQSLNSFVEFPNQQTGRFNKNERDALEKAKEKINYATFDANSDLRPIFERISLLEEMLTIAIIDRENYREKISKLQKPKK